MQETSAPATKDTNEPVLTRKPRPKLTIDHLQDPVLGLEEIYANFQKAFAAKTRGVGHEGHDMRELLGLYDRWRQMFFPQGTFEAFIQKIEKIGHSKECQNLLRQYRQRTAEALKSLAVPPPLPPLPPATAAGDAIVMSRQAWTLDAEIDDVLDSLNL